MSFYKDLVAAMTEPENPHTCEESCETGEEIVTWYEYMDSVTFTPAPEFSASAEAEPIQMRTEGWHQVQGPRRLRPEGAAFAPEGEVVGTVNLPFRPGRLSREGLLKQARLKHPGFGVSVDCEGRVKVLPA